MKRQIQLKIIKMVDIIYIIFKNNQKSRIKRVREWLTFLDKDEEAKLKESDETAISVCSEAKLTSYYRK